MVQLSALFTLVAGIGADFEAHLRCPHAKLWLTHGAEKASQMLGMVGHGHRAASTAADRCAIADGFPGGAHQNAASPGYSQNCSGAPGQASPYMWPVDFSFTEEDTVMNADSDEPIAHFKSNTFYLLSKNWKRSDVIDGKAPSRPATHAPDRELTTVLHRNENIVFIQWANGTDFSNVSQIVSCVAQKVGAVGTIRPDWFLDSRPYSSSDIASQYLGNQHIVHDGKPTLVKQWRKSDFVENYFVMSMQEHPGADGIRWPLQIAIPGEAAGPDTLRVMTQHKLLNASNEESLKLFLIDQEYVAAGGECKSDSPVTTDVWACSVCAKEYIPEEDGDGLPFEDLPDDWVCPRCGYPKSAYRKSTVNDTTVSLQFADSLFIHKDVVPSGLEKNSTFWRDIEYTFSPFTTSTTTTRAPIDSFKCKVCKHIYDPDADGKGKTFEELPDDWVCPVCGSPKSAFAEVLV
jgi:rubredoxin